jgi:peptide chain release factor 2
MKDLIAKVKKIKSEFAAIRKNINLAEKQETLTSLKTKSTDPKLWDDPEHARNLMQEIGNLESEIDEIEKLNEEISILAGLVSEGQLTDRFKAEVEDTEKKLKKLKLSSFLSDPYDRKDAIVSIHAGQGGTEAMDWTSMLYRMYLRYCEKRSWKTEVLDYSAGEEAGIKSVSFKVQGNYAFGYLKAESGTHRLVRQSPFNADKLRQTSFALVEVLPDLEDVDLPDIEISEDDLDWQFFRASTQGGQNVQKVSTAVRLTHKPTGIVVTAQTERYQEQNRKNAMNLLRAKLWALEQKKKEEKIEDIKGEYRPASWGTQIRSYVLHPYKMVKDLRTQVKSSDPEGVLDGNLDEFIEAELKLNKSSK